MISSNSKFTKSNPSKVDSAHGMFKSKFLGWLPWERNTRWNDDGRAGCRMACLGKTHELSSAAIPVLASSLLGVGQTPQRLIV